MNYGSRISDIHIKDVITVPVVFKGNADFEKFFNKLSEIDYSPLLCRLS